MTVTEQRPRRGRPRPAETIRRDETVLAKLKENPDGLSRNEIAEFMGINTSLAWLSLNRLRNEGLAEKVSPEGSQADKDTLWVAAKEP